MDLSIKSIDEYLSHQPAKVRPVLQKIRQTVKTIAPDAQEVISYGMPAFKYRGRILLYFAGFKKHCSLFPGSKAVIQKFSRELKGYKTSAGTISFTAERPLPSLLLKKIIRIRVQENLDKAQKKITGARKK